MLKVAPALVTDLEKRVGMQLDQAALTDLLIPTFNKGETMYDVDLVQRLVEHFLLQEQIEASIPGREPYPEKNCYSSDAKNCGSNALMKVARLLDSYLTEVSRDRNLSLTKFQVFAEALPESARTCDDGLYRAVDSYLKAHQTLTEHERKRLCRVMDTQKLSMDACMHAAQNERLPLRIVVQVLFSEQVKLNNAIANSSLKDELHQQPVIPTRRKLLESTPQSFQEGWSAAKKDINTLKFELQNMKAKYSELQNEIDNLHRQMEKVTITTTNTKKTGKYGWISDLKKLGKLAKMGNEVQESNVVVEQVVKKGPRRWRNSIS